MKIFTIAATPFFSDRGCHIRIYNEAKYLQKLGADVFIYTYHLGQDVAGLQVKRISQVKWYDKISPGFHWGKIWLDTKLLALCAREMRQIKPDVIHAHLYEGLVIGKLAKILSRVKAPLVFDLQGDLEKEFESYNKKNHIARRFFSILAKIAVRWADAVVISSERSYDSINAIYKGEVTVARDGVDLELFQAPELKSSQVLKDISDWKGDKKLLLYTGSLEQSKGVGEMLQAFIAVASELSDWKLLLAGHGKDFEKYRMLIKQSGLEERIRLAGRTNYFDLPKYLAAADLAIDPKTDSTESSGKLVNYMAAGLAVICFKNSFNESFLKAQGLYISFQIFQLCAYMFLRIYLDVTLNVTD